MESEIRSRRDEEAADTPAVAPVGGNGLYMAVGGQADEDEQRTKRIEEQRKRDEKDEEDDEE